MRRVGVLLSGCGTYDGSEIQETVLLVLALARRGMESLFLAPDVEQRDVVDHSTGDTRPEAAPRRVLVESARIARGVVAAVHETPETQLDALAIPGGMGAVKNLCLEGPGLLGLGPLRPDVVALLDALTARKAPVAVMGLAEVVLARHQGRPLGQEPVYVPASEVVVDEERRTLFTPGFMGSDDLEEVAVGIDRLADHLARWLGVHPELRLRKGKPG
ncbi:MAG: isoprenoid biosynthesis protein ElbB [Acidobacteriia bacterium]|nr:isoprenoid biosynthesis protein ElbB [Terriglobia bacterium]